MFAKPYKLKSNNALKNSEKKHLAQRVQDEFLFATEEKAKEIVPLKGSCTCMKLVLHSGDMVNVYAVDGAPMLVETAAGLLPTVCALWKVPDLVPVLTIHTPVLQKVQNGAPLYLPGVSLPAQGAGFPVFQSGTVLAACTEDNMAACVVGRAAISSADMLLRASGVCMDVAHVWGDSLCKDNKFNKVQRPASAPRPAPAAGAPALAAGCQKITLQFVQETWPALGKTPRPAPPPAPAPSYEPRVIPAYPVTPAAAAPPSHPAGDDMLTDTPSPPAEGTAPEVPTDADALLRWTLLSFLKLEGRRVELPLKTNLLYKNYLLVLCPPNRTLDVKKSSYKKLGKFLDAMQQEGLIEVREIEKGVDAVVAVNPAHPAARAHAPAGARAVTAAPAPSDREYTPPRVRECYCVTASVLPLFAPLKKGAAVSPAEVRGALTDWVRTRIPPAAPPAPAPPPGSVLLDATLAAILNKPQQEAVKWDALTAGVLARMTPSTEMVFADGTRTLTKTRLQPVTMRVVQRSGNKKVTLVSNLESFGFNLSSLAHECQRGAAATCGVTRDPGAVADQLMLQGDQTYFVAKLLTEKYELPKKFVEGADKALKKKK